LISSKRPVPLEHFLYTGNSTSTNKELFMIIDADQKFLSRKSADIYSEYKNVKLSLFICFSSHDSAMAAKAARKKDHQNNYGAKTRYDSNLSMNQVINDCYR
jgi:superfamily II RNA helicase